MMQMILILQMIKKKNWNKLKMLILKNSHMKMCSCWMMLNGSFP